MLADILPTGYEVGVLNGQVRPGDVVAVVGAGPDRPRRPSWAPGSSARPTSWPSTWPTAGSTPPSSSAPTSWSTTVGRTPLAVVRELTGGLGADVAIEAVGVPDTFELATRLARPGGHIANIGVHGTPATLHLEELWIRNVTITTGLVDTYSTPTLLRLAQGKQVDAGRFVTHHFTLDQFEEAYDVFGNAADTGALKVVLTRA